LRLLTPAFLVAAVLLSACAQDSGPQVTIANVSILAPMPGRSAGVAYFMIENRGDTTITINRIDSPQYDNVQMHETTIEDGVSRMRQVESFQVNPSSEVEFKMGGKHVMLMGPTTNVLPGSPVTLEIHYDSGLLIVNAIMQDRSLAQ